MALARLALKNMQQTTSSSLLSRNVAQNQRYWGSQLLRRLSSGAGEKPTASGEVAVEVADGGGKKAKLFPRRRSKRGLWRRNNNGDYVPGLWESFPSGLGNALIQATENINRLVENLSPWNLSGRAKEHDDSYKLRYQMPGLSKEDVKVTVEDGVLNIRGEHKEEEEEGSDDEYWSAKRYGYYNTSILLPDDAKVDGIKAEMKDGVLSVVVPKSERVKKDVKEVMVE